MESKAKIFEYKIGFIKKGSTYHLSYYNSPYSQSENELEDISLIMDGKDLLGRESEGHKVVDWERIEDGTWEVLVNCYFIPHNDGTYDQTFKLKAVEKK